MRLYHTENESMFYYLLGNSKMMSDPGNRSLLGLLLINKPLGITGMAVRKDIFKQDKIFLTKADLEFSSAFFVYDCITKVAMRDIFRAMLRSENIREFRMRLSPLGDCYIYAQVKAALAYYQQTLYSTIVIPDVNIESFTNGIFKLKFLRSGIEELFRPEKQQFTRLRYMMPGMTGFMGKYGMAWYLCNTDLAWSQVLIQALKSKATGIMKPLNYFVQALEPFVQGYFNAYVSGIQKLSHGQRLTDEEYTVLRMSFETDVKTYEEFSWYYYRCSILPDRFFIEMELFINNVKLMLKKVEDNYRGQI